MLIGDEGRARAVSVDPPAPGLVGRCTERDLLARALDEASTGSSRLLFLGETGIGKTSLLLAGAARARQLGFRVLHDSGKGTPDLGLLRRLVAPLVPVVAQLPGSLRRPLDELLTGAGTQGPGSEPTALRPALLTLIRRVAQGRPVAIVVDDAQDADRDSLAVLSFLSRKLSTEHVLLLFAARGLLPPDHLDADLSVCHIGPLSGPEAAILLGRQPNAPTGWIRGEVLRHAGGNPLFVIELARSAVGTGPTGYRLNVPERIRRAYADQIDPLPATTRRVLLCAAAAEAHDHLQAVLSSAGADLADCGPAEAAGLITVVGNRVSFRNPAVRLACYFGASERDRRQAHQALAGSLVNDVGSHAWHSANAAEHPGEDVALLLESAAAVAHAQGRHVEAAGALQRAADHSRTNPEAARRYARAAHLAMLGGHYDWARQLSDQVALLTDDPDVLGAAMAGPAQHLPLHDPAPVLVPRIRRLFDAGLQDRGVAMALTATAGTAVLMSGDPAQREMLAGIVDRAERLTSRTGLGEELCPEPAGAAVVASARVICDPGGRPAAPPGLREPQSGRGEIVRLLTSGTMSWVADAPGAATGYLRSALHRLREDNAQSSHPFAFVMLIDALTECGLWQAATAVQAEAAEVAAAGGLPLLGRAVAAQAIVLQTLRGDDAAAQDALRTLDPWLRDPRYENRTVRCLVHRAAGRVHAVAGDHERACTHYLAMFGPDGEPQHFAWSHRAVVELARSAAKVHRQVAASRAVAAVRRSAGGRPPGRLSLLADHAAALLDTGTDDPGAEAVLRTVADRALIERPYDHAIAMVDYADWLRARRRSVDARPLLSAAHDTFLRIGATRDADSTRARLRAAGASMETTIGDGFALLTAQQQMIARLAAQGLSNRAIADQLVLSPRTIGSHLYQIYPKLGVINRRQLLDVIPE